MASSPSPSPSRMIVVKSSDGETFELEEAAASMSVTLKNAIEDDCTGGTIPLPNVDSATLSKVAEYCKHHAAPGAESTNKEFDETFMAEYLNGNIAPLFELILAANYLEIKELMQLTCQAVADKIAPMSVEGVRKLFNVENDFTPEEEEEVRKENEWAFENVKN